MKEQTPNHKSQSPKEGPKIDADAWPLVVKAAAAVAPLSQIRPPGTREQPIGAKEPTEPVYGISRCGRQATITGDDIARAVRVQESVVGGPEGFPLEDLRAALTALSHLPADFTVTDPGRPVYAFPGPGVQAIHITNPMIRAAEQALATLPR